ncbi:MAG: hypothetical protein ACOCRK_01100 [bacterium]
MFKKYYYEEDKKLIFDYTKKNRGSTLLTTTLVLIPLLLLIFFWNSLVYIVSLILIMLALYFLYLTIKHIKTSPNKVIFNKKDKKIIIQYISFFKLINNKCLDFKEIIEIRSSEFYEQETNNSRYKIDIVLPTKNLEIWEAKNVNEKDTVFNLIISYINHPNLEINRYHGRIIFRGNPNTNDKLKKSGIVYQKKVTYKKFNNKLEILFKKKLSIWTLFFLFIVVLAIIVDSTLVRIKLERTDEGLVNCSAYKSLLGIDSLQTENKLINNVTDIKIEQTKDDIDSDITTTLIIKNNEEELKTNFSYYNEAYKLKSFLNNSKGQSILVKEEFNGVFISFSFILLFFVLTFINSNNYKILIDKNDQKIYIEQMNALKNNKFTYDFNDLNEIRYLYKRDSDNKQVGINMYFKDKDFEIGIIKNLHEAEKTIEIMRKYIISISN